MFEQIVAMASSIATRVIRSTTRRIIRDCMGGLIAVCLIVSGIGLATAAACVALTEVVGAATALLILGFGHLVVAVLIGWAVWFSEG